MNDNDYEELSQYFDHSSHSTRFSYIYFVVSPTSTTMNTNTDTTTLIDLTSPPSKLISIDFILELIYLNDK